MSSGLSKGRNTKIIWLDLLYYLLGATAIFLIIYKLYKPNLLYFKWQPFFSKDSSFIDFHFRERDGLLSLSHEFIAQYLHYPVWGSLMITLLLVLLAFIYRLILRPLMEYGGRGLEFVPAIIILSSLKNYETHLDVLFLFLYTGIFVLGNKPLKRVPYIRLIYQLISIYLFYRILGPVACMVLVVFHIFDDLLLPKGSKQILSVSCLIVGYLVMLFLFTGYALAKDIFVHLGTLDEANEYVHFWLILVIYIIGFIISILLQTSSVSQTAEKITPKPVTTYLLLVAMAVVIVLFRTKIFRFPNKIKTKIEYYADTDQWNEIVRLKDRINPADQIEVFLLNRAFYHTGKMTSDMFSFRQAWGDYSLLLKNSYSGTLRWTSDLYFDMGSVKAAEYWALEAQTFFPYNPHLMKRLASCALLLKETPMAKKYLNILKGSVIYSPWVNEIEGFIAKQDTSVLRHVLIAVKPLDETVIDYLNPEFPEADLIKLHQANKNSKMVYEYLMSDYLLNNDLTRFYDLLPDYSNFDTTGIPVTYQQALLLYDILKDINPDSQPYKLSTEIRKHFFQFNKIMVDQKNPARIRELHKEYFRDTYWYYLRYISPKTLHKEFKKK